MAVSFVARGYPFATVRGAGNHMRLESKPNARICRSLNGWNGHRRVRGQFAAANWQIRLKVDQAALAEQGALPGGTGRRGRGAAEAAGATRAEAGGGEEGPAWEARRWDRGSGGGGTAEGP